MTCRKKPGVAFWAAVAMVVVLVGYVASYAMLVEPQTYAWPYAMTVAAYRWPGSAESLQSAWWQRAFAPLEAADRKLRRERWVTPPSISDF